MIPVRYVTPCITKKFCWGILKLVLAGSGYVETNND